MAKVDEFEILLTTPFSIAKLEGVIKSFYDISLLYLDNTSKTIAN